MDVLATSFVDSYIVLSKCKVYVQMVSLYAEMQGRTQVPKVQIRYSHGCHYSMCKKYACFGQYLQSSLLSVSSDRAFNQSVGIGLWRVDLCVFASILQAFVPAQICH